MNSTTWIIGILSWIALLIVGSCSTNHDSQFANPNLQNLESELVGLGSNYPNYYFNLGRELQATERNKEALEAYKMCIETTQNQTFLEEAFYNSSILNFHLSNEAEGYRFMDTLLERKFAWLEWFNNSNHPYIDSLSYKSRLLQIDSIQNLRNSPYNATFHFEDVDNFVTAFEKSNIDWANAPQYFYNDYFSKASSALFYYQKFKIRSSSHKFSYRVQDRRAYFNSILPNLKSLKNQEKKLREYLVKFEELYPDAVFPDIYFVVGCFNSGGTATGYGLIIGSEMHAMEENSDLTNFSNWEKNVVRGYSNLPLITIHELVHTQQNNNYSTVLGNSIFEGAADFVSDLICGSHINEFIHVMADKKEEEIWAEFKKDMYNNNYNDWIGNGGGDNVEIPDLGYYIGYKICKSYYDKQEDKAKALRDILTIQDWHTFYEYSGYMQ